ncbi:13814_t:CDS:2, partial [Acaulospora colombiana]
MASPELEELYQKLQHVTKITPNYAQVPVELGFNWDEIAESAKDVEGEFYLVAFRSTRRADADNKLLYEADDKAYDEAKLSDGFVKYWCGELNERRECLSFCIWANHDCARKSASKPHHAVAINLAA